MRHRYGFNSQVVNWGNFNEITPLGYIDTVPGETISGSVQVAVRSQPTVLAVDTRAYLDVFAFYVPFRLLWDGFPTFVAQAQNEGQAAVTMPLVSDLFPFNFESRFTVSSAGTYDRNTPFLRYMYNTIWNKFFRMPSEAERALTANTVAYVATRPSRLETRPLLGGAASYDTTFGLGGTSPNQFVSVNALRTALATDRFGRMRSYYGAKYTDYLASLGVEVEWSLLEEPEVLGQKHVDWKYQRVAQTAGVGGTAPQNTVGQMAGQFFSKVSLPIKRMFSPEHGLIAVYGVTRADPVFPASPCPPILCKQQPVQYWSPEYETITGSGINPAPFLTTAVFGAATSVGQWPGLAYEDYRTGLNYNRNQTNGPQYGLAYNQSGFGTDQYVHMLPGPYNQNFTQPTVQQYQATAEHRLIRESPVKRIDTRLKLA